MRALKIKVWQDSAHFRVPHTTRTLQTLPVPMFSTALGFLCTPLGKDGRKRLLEGIQLAIYSRHTAGFEDRIWHRNMSIKQHLGRFGSRESRLADNRAEHPGGQSPVTIERLHDVTTVIYAICDAGVMSELERIFSDGSMSLSLGLAEDTVLVREARVMDFGNDPEPFHGKVDFFSWLPERNDGKGLPSNYGEFFSRIPGNTKLVSSRYSIVNVGGVAVRDFTYSRCKLFSPRGLPVSFTEQYSFYIDHAEKIPLWFAVQGEVAQ